MENNIALDYMVPVYGLQVVMNKATLDPKDKDKNKRLVPKAYVNYVMEWLEDRAERLTKK